MGEQPPPVVVELQLHVVSVHNGARVSLPYRPQMPCYKYLKEVVVPALGCYTRDHGASVIERFVYYPPIETSFALALVRPPTTTTTTTTTAAPVVVFTRANRLRRLGEVVPPDAVLHRVLAFLGPHPNELRGNAARGDLGLPCGLCASPAALTNHELVRCAHRFHAGCIGRYMAATDPARWRCRTCDDRFDALLESARIVTALGLDEQYQRRYASSAASVGY